jgi:hypothetical protein
MLKDFPRLSIIAFTISTTNLKTFSLKIHKTKGKKKHFEGASQVYLILNI